MAAGNKWPRQIGLWICSALITALLVAGMLVADRFRKGPENGPAMTIQVDHPGVMEGDAAALIAFMERAVIWERGSRIDVRFLGKSTDLTVSFGGNRWDPGVKMDGMEIQVGPTAYVERGDVIDGAELAGRMKPYCEGAARLGTVPDIELRVNSDVSLRRLLEFFELSASFGHVVFDTEEVSISLP